MIIKELIQIIEQQAPLSLQESYDNSGLIVGQQNDEISGVLLCVDISEDIIDEAIEKNCNLIISHHPIIFHPIKKLTGENITQRTVISAIKNNIALYSSHTPLDKIPDGLSHALAKALNISEREILSDKDSLREDCGFGIIGSLNKPKTLNEILQLIKTQFELKVIRYSKDNGEKISKIAICTGSGASLISRAKKCGAHLYISADFKYNDFIDADKDLIIADIGHFESEYCAINVLYDIITKKITTFAIHKSEQCSNPVNYFV
ncbi:MAG: Nif3-like dinuclear metal center hexameric protein [Rikenellaceae bacterium]